MTESYGEGGLRLAPGRIATLTLARPATRNALTRAMWQALPAICARIAGDAVIRVLIVTGEGGRAFSSGADISEFAEVYGTDAAIATYNAEVRSALAALRDLPRPVIAAIEGACAGGGCGLALACDQRIAAPDARFALTPARLGLAYSPADTWTLIEKVGAARAKDLLMTGRSITAEEALRIGLVDRVESDPRVVAHALADHLASLSASALAAIKAIANGLTPPPEAAALQEMFAATFASDDFREGYRAFLEKRAPNFERGPDT